MAVSRAGIYRESPIVIDFLKKYITYAEYDCICLADLNYRYTDKLSYPLAM